MFDPRALTGGSFAGMFVSMLCFGLAFESLDQSLVRWVVTAAVVILSLGWMRWYFGYCFRPPREPKSTEVGDHPNPD